MSGLLNFLFGDRASFYKFESDIIEAVKSRLDVNTSTLLQHQIEKINKIQRLADGKEVNLYQMQRGKPAFDNNLRFPDASGEALLASANLVHPEKRTKLKVEMWLANGRLFSLVFNKSPKQFFAGSDLKSVQPEITDVKILFDPMSSVVSETKKIADDVTLTRLLHDWFPNTSTTELRKPLSDSERKIILDRIDAQLPFDYLELTVQTEGAKIGNCRVYGLSEIRKTILPDQNYYLLAEIEGNGVLAVKEGCQDAKVYFLNYEDNEVSLKGGSFKEAVASSRRSEKRSAF